MGYVETEQAVRLIETGANAVRGASQPPPPESQNYWWLLLIAIAPVVVGTIFQINKKSKK